MKKNTKRLIQIIGGIIMMTGISGCGASGNHQDTSSSITESRVKASRTSEAVAVEAQFEPLFEFLAAEKKDFSRVERYSSSFDVDIFNEEIGEYVTVNSDRILFDNLRLSNEGMYSIKNNEKFIEHMVELDIRNGVVIQTDTDSEINHYIIPTIVTEEIRQNMINAYSTNHPETALTTLSYKATSNLSFIKMMIDKYQIKEVKDTQLYMSKQGDAEYSFQIGVTSKERKSYTLSISVTFKD